MVQQTEILESPEARYLAWFERERGSLPGAGLAWADALRDDGMAAFARLGFPSRRVEAWKYTDLKALARIDFAPAPVTVNGVSEALASELARTRQATHCIVFVNGHFRADLSRLGDLPEGVRLASLATLLEAGDPVVANHLGHILAPEDRPLLNLNTALMEDGFVLELAPNAVVVEPIEVLYLTDRADGPIACHPRTLIVAGHNSQAAIVEVHRGVDDMAYFSNGAAEVTVGEGARLRHYRLQFEGAQAFHLSNTLARVGKDATYETFALTLGGALSRIEAYALLDGPGADCHLNGAYMGDVARHIDNTTLIDHAQPECRSRQVFQGVLDGRARGVFQGKIIVRRGAQHTDGHQLSRALLLSKGAEVDAKPELEIYADDVKCSHGATAGEIDDQALFYLRTRGIDETSARGLLIEAFIDEAIDEITIDAVRDRFAGAVGEWLGARGPEKME